MLTHQACWNPPIRLPWRFLPRPSGGWRGGTRWETALARFDPY